MNEQRERIVDSLYRIVRLMLIRMNRDHETCGKQSCRRSRRCRGEACEREIEAED